MITTSHIQENQLQNAAPDGGASYRRTCGLDLVGRLVRPGKPGGQPSDHTPEVIP